MSGRNGPIPDFISFNTQSNFTGGHAGSFGNGFHSFGMQIMQAQGVNDSGTRWYLVDSDGSEWNYGAASGSPSAPAAAYSALNQVSGGFTLTDAGPPGKIEQTGQYKYEFNSSGNLTKVTNPDQNEQVLTYSSGKLTQVTDSASGKTLDFSYNGAGLVSTISHNGAGETHLSYTDGLITQIDLTDGGSSIIRSVALTYNEDNSIHTIERDDDSASTVTFSYMDNGDGLLLANVTHPNGSTNYNYSTAPPSGYAFRTTHTNAKGGETQYDYDINSNMLRSISPIPDGATSNPTSTYTYDSNRNLLTASNGATSYTMTYNSLGLLTRVEDGAGKYRAFTYSGTNLTQVSDNIGTVRQYTYTNSSLPHTPITMKDGDTDTWSYDYNSNGQLTEVTPPTSSPLGVEETTYDETTSSVGYGMPLQSVNGAGDETDYGLYDDEGNLLEVSTSPTSSVTDTTAFTYDAAGRVLGEEYGDGKDLVFTYAGRDLTDIEDEAGTTRTFSYCPGCGRVTGVAEPLSRTLSWDLDTDFAVTHFTDPGSNSSEFKFGNAKDLKEIIFPGGDKFAFTYDNYGRLKTSKYPGSSVGTNTYNSSGEVTAINYSGSSNHDLSYTYLNDGRVSTATTYNGTATYTYTNDRQIASVSYNFGARGLSNAQKLEYTYYTDGLLNTLTWKNGTSTVASWTYTYDGAGRVTEVSNSFGQTVEYEYDGEGKITTQTNGNGTSTEYQYYEPRDWVTKITHYAGTTKFDEYTLEYDDNNKTVGNITKVTELGSNVVDYDYDALYRLTSEVRTGTGSYSKSYGYDLSGNVTTLNGSTFASYDSANKISSIVSGTIDYNGTGNPQKVGVTSYGGACGLFNYDSRGYLSQQKTCTSSGEINYTWDGQGRMEYRTNKLGIFSGDKLVGEISKTGTLLFAYTWGPDGLAAHRNIQTSKSRYYHYGPQGETRYLSGNSAAVTDTYRYTGWGVPTYTSGTSENSQRYGGKYGYYTEGSVGIIFAGARVYHPYIMRWLQRDPILFDGGANVWEYVKGNPIRYVDPEGREPKSTLGGDDPGHENPEEVIRQLEELLKDPTLSQRERSKIRKRIRELRRRPSKKQQHHCDSTPNLFDGILRMLDDADRYLDDLFNQAERQKQKNGRTGPFPLLPPWLIPVL